MTEDVAVAEAAVAIDRERRMVRHHVVEIEPAEPSVGQVQLDFLAQPPLKADAVAVAHNQHPEHEFGINRRPANVAVKGLELRAQLSQHPRHDRIDAVKEMARWNTLFEIEQVEQLALIARLLSHHGRPPSLTASSRRNHCSPIIASPFSTPSARSRNVIRPGRWFDLRILARPSGGGSEGDSTEASSLAPCTR
jgi:hypothetical protein